MVTMVTMVMDDDDDDHDDGNDLDENNGLDDDEAFASSVGASRALDQREQWGPLGPVFFYLRHLEVQVLTFVRPGPI